VTDLLTYLVALLNAAANAIGRVALAPLAALPGWLSATLVSAVTGVPMLLVFKYTSNQRAIKRVRSDIQANLLALKLFKDSAAVALRAQGRLLVGAGQLVVLAVVPMLVMLVPVTLLLGQLALWYQARPLRVGEDALVTMKLNGDPAAPWPDVRLEPSRAMEVTLGPVRVQSKRMICWNIQARENGNHHLVFNVNGQPVDKELAIGDGFMRVSMERPDWDWSEALLHPWEPPFRPDSPVQSIAIDYPPRDSWTSGTDMWVIYWFIASMVSAVCCLRVFNVNV
jgi:hypothetical protein